MLTPRFNKIVTVSLLGAVMLLSFFALPSLAQDVVQINPVGQELNLAGGAVDGVDSLRDIVLRVIRWILGLVGLIAVIVILYGGFLWMTSAGNADRVTRARAVIVNGLIGLVIIIASFAIVSLVAWFTSDVVLNAPADSCIENEVRACGSCGGTQVCGADGTYGECNAPALCPESAPFGLLSYTPTDNDNPVNTTVKMRFKKDVEDVSNAVVQGYFTLTQVDTGGVSSSVPGVVTYALNSSGQPIKSRLVFTPSAVCSEDATQNCFDKNVAVTVSINDQLKSESGERLTCPASGCTWTFGIGEGFDRDPPTASIVLPRNRAIPQSTNAELRLRALDDYKLSSAWFEVGAGQIIGSMPGFPTISSDYLPANGSPRRIDASAFWNTSSLALFSEHEIKVYADDVAGRGPVEATKIVTVVAPHCDNNTRDGDETDIDCGGSCLACGAPIITRVEPADAAPGDYIQISGRYFGNTPGRIVFSGPDREFGTPDDVVGVTPLACALGDTWTDKQIIIGVPAFAIDADDDGVNDTSYQFDSNILVENSSGDFSDTTSWGSPPLFVNTNVKRPSICSLSKDEIRLCAEGEDRQVQVAGIKFGGNPAGPGRVMFGSFEGFVSEWQTALPQNTAIASLPTIEPGEVGVRVESPVKYCVGGTNAWTACTDNSVCASGECAAPLSNPINLKVLSCTAKPIINAITPTAGPQGQIVTITGSNFGDSPRQVIFRQGANEKSATFDFNNQCSATSYWKNNQIIARVPADIEEGQFDVVVRVQPVPNLIESDPAIFTVNDSDRTPALICALPDNGPIGTSVRFVGESFGDDAGAITFTPNKPATISNGNWEDSVVQTSVPNDAISGSVVATNAGGITSNPVAFTVGSCQQGGCAAGTVCCGDGTCRATREECPVPPAKPLSSYRWRVTTGDPAPRVVEQAQCLVNFVQNWSFENYDENTNIPTNWDVSQVDPNIDVDGGLRDGAALLTNAAGVITQRLSVPLAAGENLVVRLSAKGTTGDLVEVFLIDDKPLIYVSDQTLTLSQTDTWQEFTIIGSPTQNTVFSDLRIVLPAGVMIDDISVQSASSATATTQSPGPFRDTKDACLNTALSVRFTTPLGTGPGSLGTVRLLKCDDQSCNNTTPVVVPPPTPLGVDGLIVSTPLLLANSWYQASVEGVKSNRGVTMQSSYIWKFRTGGETCAIAGASCSPPKHILESSSANVLATAGLQALNCNLLTCTSSDINWTSQGDGVTLLGSVGACSVPIRVKTPNPREGKDTIRPQIVANPNAVVGMCEIEVKFSPLRVVGVFPNCDVACLNAQPIVALSAEVSTVFEGGNEVVGVGNYTFEECVDRSCSQSVDISNDVWLGPIILNPEDARGLKLPIDSNYYAIRFVNNLDLLPNKFYRVTLLGGDNGLRSIDNKILEGGTFSWVFGTKDKECGVDRMSLSPKDVTVRTLGAKVRYSTSPFSTGDDCAPGGQLLVATKYNYQWSTLPEGIATLSTLNILPPSPNTDTYLDPVQYATSVGLSEECRQGDSTCDTTVSATELSTNNAGSGLLTLQCGFTPPGACRALSSNLAENGNFEAGADEDDPQWAKGWLNIPLNILIDGGGSVGGKYFRADAALRPRYQVTLPSTLTRPTKYTVGFYAKSATPTSPSFVFNDNVNHTFSETSGADWKYFETTVEAGVGQEEISVDIVSDHDIDGLVIFQHACTNDSSQICSINADCQISGTDVPLNLCGVDVDGNGINDPVGTCEIAVGETVGSCDNDGNIECRTNNDCNLAVNSNGCCGVRPYVSLIQYANYTDADSGDEFMCLNTGFDIDFNTLMDRSSLDGKVTLEWLDDEGAQNCEFDEQITVTSTFSRIFAFIKQLFGLDANANNHGRWCGVPVSVVSSTKFNDITKQPQYTRVTVYPRQLLSNSDNVVYRIVVKGEKDADPTGGVRSIYGVQLSESTTGDFVQSLVAGTLLVGGDLVLPIGDRICDIERVSVEIDPPLSSDSSLVSTRLQPRDFFQCVGDDCVCKSATNPNGANPGEPGCRLTDISTVPVSEDQERTIPEDGNQHIYTAFATTADDLPLSASWSWERIDPQSILRNPVVNDEFTQSVASVTIDPPDGRRRGYAQVRVSASPLGVTEGIGASNTVNVLFDRCADPWSESLNDTVDNFSTTYCADYGDENTLSDNLPQFILSDRFTTTNSPLNIRSEYILKHPDAVDAIAVRSVSNEFHLTPQQWYNEQSFEKGSPRVIDGGVDGYQAIVDGRTAYLGFANVPNTQAQGAPAQAMYTNILIISHSQNAGSDTVEVFKRLIDGILFNTNKLNPGQCRGVQLTCSVNSSENAGNICETDAQCGNGQCGLATELGSCLIDSDCSDGLVCTGEKARISRDLSRFTRLLDVQSKLIDYQYGTSCPNVTPGAPGDADCNGVINGRDVVRAQSYVKATPVAPPAFCKGADFDLNDEVTSADVGAIQQLVRQQCTRPAGRSSAFPRLNEGTFVENMTTSVWPSWQETFGRDLGGGLPTDPINLFSQCGGGSVPGPFPHSPYTCWDPNTRTYASFNTTLNDGNLVNANIKPDVPAGRVVNGTNLGSHVFAYAANTSGNDYALCSYFETLNVPYPPAIGQVTGASNRVCVASSNSFASGLPPVPPYSVIESFGSSFLPNQAYEVTLTITGSGAQQVAMEVVGENSVTCKKSSIFSSRCTLFVERGNAQITLTPSTGAGMATIVPTSWINCPTNVIPPSNKCVFSLDARDRSIELVAQAKSSISIQAETGVPATAGPSVQVYVDGVLKPTINDVKTPTVINDIVVGSLVELVPNFGSQYLFGNWTGPCAGQGESCAFVVKQNASDNSVKLDYRSRGRILQVEHLSVNGQFGGDVKRIIGGTEVNVLTKTECDKIRTRADGSVACRTYISSNNDEIIILEAVPDTASGKTVDSVKWFGCEPDSAREVCRVNMTSDKTVRVQFGDSRPTLTISKSVPNGTRVSVVSTDPAGLTGIECGDGCTTISRQYQYGNKITLQATTDSRFGSFSGYTCTPAVSGVGTCTNLSDGRVEVTLNGSMTVNANFTNRNINVNIDKKVGGATDNNAGIIEIRDSTGGLLGKCDTGQPCNIASLPIPTGETNLQFVAIPVAGYAFSNGWSGGQCTMESATTCSAPINNPINITATFTRATANLTLKVRSTELNQSGAGSGILALRVRNTAGVESTKNIEPRCASITGTLDWQTCSVPINVGDRVILSATQNDNYYQHYWGVQCSGPAATCEFNMDGAKTVELSFERATVRLNVCTENTDPDNYLKFINYKGEEIRFGQNLAEFCSSFPVHKNTEVTVSAIDGTGDTKVFSEWPASTVSEPNECSGTNPLLPTCTAGGNKVLVSDNSKTVRARFVQTNKLFVKKWGTGVGSVTVRYEGGQLIGSHTYTSTNGDVAEFDVITGRQIVLSADYGSGIISTFMCPSAGGSFATEITSPPGGLAFCNPVEVTGNMTAQVRFNTPPTFNDESLTAQEDVVDAQFYIDFIDSDYAVDSHALSRTNPSNGSLRCDPSVQGLPGIFRTPCFYTPNLNFSGTDTFEYVISDGRYNTGLTPGTAAWNSVKKIVTVTVSAVNDPPEITSVYCNGGLTTCNVLDGDQLSLICQATDVESTSLSYSWNQSGGTVGTIVQNPSNENLFTSSIPTRLNQPIEIINRAEVSPTTQCGPTTCGQTALTSVVPTASSYSHITNDSLMVIYHHTAFNVGAQYPEFFWKGNPLSRISAVDSVSCGASGGVSSAVYVLYTAVGGDISADLKIDRVTAVNSGENITVLSVRNLDQIGAINTGCNVNSRITPIALSGVKSDSTIIVSAGWRGTNGDLSKVFVPNSSDLVTTGFSLLKSPFSASAAVASQIAVSTTHGGGNISKGFVTDSSVNTQPWSSVLVELKRAPLDVQNITLQCSVSDGATIVSSDNVTIIRNPRP